MYAKVFFLVLVRNLGSIPHIIPDTIVNTHHGQLLKNRYQTLEVYFRSSATSSASSSLSTEFRRSQDDMISSHHMTPAKLKSAVSFPDDFPLPEDSDWPSLVDTATSFINQVGTKLDGRKEMDGKHWNDDMPVDASIASS